MTAKIYFPTGHIALVEQMTPEEVIQLALQEFAPNNHKLLPAHSMRLVDSEGNLVPTNSRTLPKEGRIVPWGAYGGTHILQ